MRQGCNSDGEVMSSFYVEHDPVPAPSGDDGVTRQEFRDECDINILLARYEKTGVINHFNSGEPQYLDTSLFPEDLQGAMLVMEMARESFMRLPATVRREFDNDPVRFADFAADASNIGQMREWGLAPPEKAPAASNGERAPSLEDGALPLNGDSGSSS